MQFEKIVIDQSVKNIPIPSNANYKKKFLIQLESFIRRLRWKAFYFDHKDCNADLQSNKSESYGFKSERCPPQHKCLTGFEDDLYELAKNLEFRKYKNPFQKELSKVIHDITNSENVIVPADKTSNFYKVPVKDYIKLLNDNITAKYRKSKDEEVASINEEAKIIACKLNLHNRMECYPNKPAFITLKDHKENFNNNPKCRLINPAKSEMGKVSKFHLDKINMKIRTSTSLNQWRNTSSVINWFKSLDNKHHCKFLKFDIMEFYPSISETLLKDSIQFAKKFTTINEDAIQIIFNARRSVLFDTNHTPWVKKDNSQFDVTMGSFDGAEICELVGLFILNKISKILGTENVGLYRDDGLAIIRSKSGPEMERTKKAIIQLFKSINLKITIECNLTNTDFLDVSFDLVQGDYKPFCKNNNTPRYVNALSNHPPNIKKEIPNMISKRLSANSSNNFIFTAAAPAYNKGLKENGYKHNIQYKKPDNKFKMKPSNTERKRKIIWFNPPFSNHVHTQIGKIFFQLLDKHFPNSNRFHKIFNRSTIKLSYCCMPNIASIINNHNRKIISKLHNINPCPTATCNCKIKSLCPLNGNCLKKSLVYKATLSTDNNSKYYFGLCETTFKTRYYNHQQSFKVSNKRNSTELSKQIWKLKDNNKDYSLSWSIIQEVQPYKCGAQYCNLCVAEKMAILQADNSYLLNKRSEIIAKCRHKNKFLLKNFNFTIFPT